MTHDKRLQVEAALRHGQDISAQDRLDLQQEIGIELSSAVYTAALIYERCEGMGLIRGNGHHMAQELATEAVKRLADAYTFKPKE